LITDRLIEADDLSTLQKSLARDESHKGTAPEFFTEPGTICKVYEDEQGPICFVRGTKALRLDIQYVDNSDGKRNMKAMLAGFETLADKARENGFMEIVFNTNSPMLAQFCKKRFGFVESAGELRRFL
jgi:hypothetical protein